VIGGLAASGQITAAQQTLAGEPGAASSLRCGANVTEQPEQERREVIFRGQVQGVGFRYTARQISARFQVVGFVRNRSDGTVQLVAEGEPEELNRFIQAVAGEFEGYITDHSSHVTPATGEFSHFGVRH
jgi:acylphosphatase